jgi:hypothetical protein
VEELGAASLQYAESLMPAIHSGLMDPLEGVRRNSAFCISVLVESSGAELAPHFPHFLQWLYPVCIRNENQVGSDTGGADVDNAIAAVARMINAEPARVPLGHVLPVMLAALPLRSDKAEGPVVYGCLVTLLRDHVPEVLSHITRLVALFGETMSADSNETEKTKDLSVEGLKLLLHNPEFAETVQRYLGSLTDTEHQRLLSDALQ